MKAPSSTTTCLPTSSSSPELKQALQALQDLVSAVPLNGDARLVSAFQQARLVLRRHGIAERRGSS